MHLDIHVQGNNLDTKTRYKNWTEFPVWLGHVMLLTAMSTHILSLYQYTYTLTRLRFRYTKYHKATNGKLDCRLFTIPYSIMLKVVSLVQASKRHYCSYDYSFNRYLHYSNICLLVILKWFLITDGQAFA